MMPFIALEHPPAIVQTIEHSCGEQRFSRNEIRDEQWRDEQWIEIPSISVGDNRYPMRQKCGGMYIRALEELNIQGFSSLIVGRGKSADEASQDFCLQVHATLQNLISKRPFEMTSEDQLKWDAITQFIDVTVYRNTAPIRVRQFGRIKKARSHSEKVVVWEDGTIEHVPIAEVDDPDYITYRPGQPFEAVVHRNPITFELIRIVSIERRREPHGMTPKEESQLLDGIGSFGHLPQNTDWTP